MQDRRLLILTNKTMESKCKCCEGTGIQINKDLLKVICPCCNGTGLPHGTVTNYMTNLD